MEDLQIGESGTVAAFNDDALGLQLIEMGVVPGETISVERIAPMGDPIAVRVSGVVLMMRRTEAATVQVQGLSKPV